MRESLPERWQVNRDLEEVREQAMGLSKGRAFQAEGTRNATVLAWKSTWRAPECQAVLWCTGFGIERGAGCCCLCFSHNLWSSVFHRWRTEGSNMWPVPSLLPIPEIRSEAFWSIMRERENLSVLAAGMSCWMSAKQQRSVIMWESCLIILIPLMGAGLKKKKELGQRTEAGREAGGQWGKKKNTAGFITLLGFGPVHVDWLTVLGHSHLFLSLPFLSFPFFVPEQVSPKAIRCCQARHVYVQRGIPAWRVRAQGGKKDIPGGWVGRRLTASWIQAWVRCGSQGPGMVLHRLGGGPFCGGRITYMHWHSSTRQIHKNAESHVCQFWKREFPIW